MKKFLVVAVALAAGAAHAGEIQLDAKTVRPTGKSEVGEQLVEVSGKCGTAAVRFSNVRQVDGELAATDQSSLTIHGVKGTLATGERDSFFLDSANELACLATPKGPMLILAAWCTASQCPEVNYQIIDTATMRQLTFYDWDKPCTRACAEKALGMKVPAALQSL